MPATIRSSATDQFRSSVPLADPTLVDPNIALPLVQGEFLVPTATGWDRLAAGAGAGDPALAMDGGMPSMVFHEQGDTSAQAIQKASVVRAGAPYLADIDVYATENGAGGLLTAADYPVGQRLVLVAMDTDAVGEPHAGRTILGPADVFGAAGSAVVAEVEEPPAAMGQMMAVRVYHTPVPRT